jgi:hypothetical protein
MLYKRAYFCSDRFTLFNESRYGLDPLRLSVEALCEDRSNATRKGDKKDIVSSIRIFCENDKKKTLFPRSAPFALVR